MKIIQAQPHHMNLVRDLFREYQSWLNTDCCFENFEKELADLPGSYSEPKGIILLAFDGEQAVACSAIRPKSNNPETNAELKRLFVKETYRGHGLGKDIFNKSMTEAEKMGYKAVFLETLPEKMQAAQFLYREYGFQTMPNDSKNADQGVECFRYSYDHNE